MAQPLHYPQGMQSGVDSSRARIAQEIAQRGEDITRIDIRPNSAQPGFFNAEGPSFRDVLDTINPLNHIPIVSDLFEEATGHTASVAAKLAGGALLGGPIGFVASLASVIFQQETGKSPVGAVYAALTGESTTAVASNEATPAAAPVEAVAEAEMPAATAAHVAANVSMDVPRRYASLAPAASRVTQGADTAVLDLYGGSNSAHASYKKAQLLPYLRDVNKSQVL